MQAALVSIIMPVYNGETFLRQAIQSVVEQDYPHWELIVADDGSTDGTRKIVEEYAHPGIRYCYQENRGQAAALNLGLNQARGAYLTTLDADDWMPADSLSRRVVFLDANPEFGAVYGNGVYCSVEGKPLAKFSEYCISNITGDLYGRLLVSNVFGTGAAVMIRRDAIERESLRYDEQIVWCQDWDFYLRLAEKVQFGYTDAVMVFYRLHNSNMTMQMPSARQQAAVMRTRRKAISAARFQQASVEERGKFFYAMLMGDLQGKSVEQRAVIEGQSFRALPAGQQARLVKLVALDAIQAGTEKRICQQWLDLARKLDAADGKTRLIALLFNLNAGLTQALLRLYRQRGKRNQAKNPMQLIAGA